MYVFPEAWDPVSVPPDEAAVKKDGTARKGREGAVPVNTNVDPATGLLGDSLFSEGSKDIAIVQTGPIISSAGLIMAATLGSLMVGDITLLVQLGFAFALGMLLDTFVVRPLLLPAFAVLTGRTGRPITGRH